jgi:adenylyl-sulfate kinase
LTHKGFTIWLTGMSGAGKSTISDLLMARFRAVQARVELLDGDIVRTNLSQGLGFSREDRDINIRRIGFVSELLTRNGVIVVVAAISPYRATREEVKNKIPEFVEVFVDCPIVGNFTGISDPYEPPPAPDVTVRSDRETVDESVDKIWRELERRGLISVA